MLSTWTSLVNKSVTVSPLREDWDLLWHCQKTPSSGPRIVPSLPYISLPKRALFQGLLGTGGLFSAKSLIPVWEVVIVLLQRALPLMFFLKREFRLHGFHLFFKWNFSHTCTWTCDQAVDKGLNCFQGYFSRHHFETLPGYFSLFSLYSSGDKNEQQSSTWEHALHVI